MRLARLLSGPDATPPSLANFDSTTVFVRALGQYLHGEDFPRLGMLSQPAASLLPLFNYLPRRAKQRLYRVSGASEAISPEQLDNVDIETFCEWVVDQYPDRGYPAAIIGSPNGAAVSLAALLGVPLLPQTFLIPVSRSVQAGAGIADIEWGHDPGQALLDANPNITLHQMHDPNQDRLMVSEVAYFRVKRRCLGPAYRQFLTKTVAPGSTIFVLDCDCHWPTTRVADRHIFQFGGFGGLEPDEYLYGSDRVERFLAQGLDAPPQWNPPAQDGQAPEAEWGFEPALNADITEFADGHGYDVFQMTIDDPRGLSGLVADLYREQYAHRDINADRLLVQNFALLDPWWTLRTGSVPYWLPFNTRAAVDSLRTYIESAGPFEEIYLTLFSNGVEAAGQASIDQWRALLNSARSRGEFLGNRPEKHPLDFGVYTQYHSALPETIPSREPLLPPLPIDEFEEFLDSHSRDSPVRISE